MIESRSSVESGEGHETSWTLVAAVSLGAKVPARWTVALRRYVTVPKSQWREGGKVLGIANDMGYVYVPVIRRIPECPVNKSVLVVSDYYQSTHLF